MKKNYVFIICLIEAVFFTGCKTDVYYDPNVKYGIYEKVEGKENVFAQDGKEIDISTYNVYLKDGDIVVTYGYDLQYSTNFQENGLVKDNVLKNGYFIKCEFEYKNKFKDRIEVENFMDDLGYSQYSSRLIWNEETYMAIRKADKIYVLGNFK